MANSNAATTHQREFLPKEAREKLLGLLSAAAPPGDIEDGTSSAATSSPQELWAGVLGVMLEGAQAQEDWGLATALVRAGADIGTLDLHAAIRGGQDELAAAFVESGAPLDAQDRVNI